MKSIAVKARVPADPKIPGSVEKSAVINVNYVDYDGDAVAALKEAVELFGIKPLLTNAFANWRVTLQSGIRSALEKGESQESIQVRFANAKMGAATVGATVDAEAAFTAKFMAATPQDREKMIAALKAKASGK
jgi:hypothetical protein